MSASDRAILDSSCRLSQAGRYFLTEKLKVTLVPGENPVATRIDCAFRDQRVVQQPTDDTLLGSGFDQI
jgi:hypothetical protein